MSLSVRKISIILIITILTTYVLARLFIPAILDKANNPTIAVDKEQISDEAKVLHKKLTIMDWHADTLLWNRNFLEASDYGKIDLPRMKQGNLSFQMLTTVTKASVETNYVKDDGRSDIITFAAIVQGWPIKTWNSLLERALYQAEKLNQYERKSNGQLVFIKSQADLQQHLHNRPSSVAVFLGTEGTHPLEGNIKNLDRMYAAGFRMFGLTHFFDNELGGSLHGVSKAGLTDFGRLVVKRMDALNVIIDLAHSSEQMVQDVLALSNRPPVISHTGLRGNCQSLRNLSDDLVKAVAAKGGLIAIGFWAAAICDDSPMGIATAIKYGIDLVGADYIALGSDWDGGVKTIASNDIISITDALLELGVSEGDIRKVMGENSINFLARWLPQH